MTAEDRNGWMDEWRSRGDGGGGAGKRKLASSKTAFREKEGSRGSACRHGRPKLDAWSDGWMDGCFVFFFCLSSLFLQSDQSMGGCRSPSFQAIRSGPLASSNFCLFTIFFSSDSEIRQCSSGERKMNEKKKEKTRKRKREVGAEKLEQGPSFPFPH